MVDVLPQPVNSFGTIDWLSFSGAFTSHVPPESMGDLWNLMVDTWSAIKPAVKLDYAKPGPARAGYNASLTDASNMMTVYSRVDDNATLIELSGRGCQHARRFGDLEQLLLMVECNVTRIDLCVDLETETAPKDFADTHTNERMKTRTSITSETGRTEYIGSQKSDRFCRVYRYDGDHPRAHLLRVEMVFRRDACKGAVKDCLTEGVVYACARAGQIYKFEHPDWKHRAETPTPTWRPETGKAGTVHWFYKQVVPAVRGLIDDGHLTKGDVTNALFTEGRGQTEEPADHTSGAEIPVQEV